MRTSEYLRRQAEACLRIARTGFDLGTAERLRVLAADLRSKAEELEEHEKDEELLGTHMIKGNGSALGGNGSGEHG